MSTSSEYGVPLAGDGVDTAGRNWKKKIKCHNSAEKAGGMEFGGYFPAFPPDRLCLVWAEPRRLSLHRVLFSWLGFLGGGFWRAEHRLKCRYATW